MLVLHTHRAADGLLRFCLVLQPAPDCYHCTHCAALPQSPLHTLSVTIMPKVVQPRPQACTAENAVLQRPCHAVSCNCAQDRSADGSCLPCPGCCPLQAPSRSDLQALFSNMLLRCLLSLCRLCHAQSYEPS